MNMIVLLSGDHAVDSCNDPRVIVQDRERRVMSHSRRFGTGYSHGLKSHFPTSTATTSTRSKASIASGGGVTASGAFPRRPSITMLPGGGDVIGTVTRNRRVVSPRRFAIGRLYRVTTKVPPLGPRAHLPETFQARLQ